MTELRTYAQFYRPAIPPATPNAAEDMFLLESGHRLNDDNISR